MSGNTIMQSTAPQSAASQSTALQSTASRPATTSLARAARELELRRGEFDLALHLGCVRTVPDEGEADAASIVRRSSGCAPRTASPRH